MPHTRSLLVLVAAATAGFAHAADFPPEQIDFFERRIRPVFAEHCHECHSAKAKKLKGGLRLDARNDLMRGGDTGPAVVPGKPDESLLITAVRYDDKDLRMPPPKDDAPRKLDNAKIADLVEWVKLGAPMPEAPRVPSSDKERIAASHWAFQPPRPPALPSVKDAAWVKSDVDRFILEKLEAAGLSPAPRADKRTLIRRATFDLTGLPPKPEEVEAFLTDASANAFATVVDRLLASPRYGERWGRHWLDVARYSDTKGYVYAREERFYPHAYAYRDWVIRAFNEDLPYDRFLLLQISADQLVPLASPDLAAMGFLTGGRRFLGVTRDIIDDRIDVVTRSTMALTVQCARCHDHKYDPIPTRDYYSLYGVFQSSAEKLIRLDPPPQRTDALAAFEKEFDVRQKKLTDTMRTRRETAEAQLRSRVGEYLAAQLELHKYPEEGFDQILTATDIIPSSVRRWRDFLHRSKAGFDPVFAPWNALAKLPADGFQEKAESTLAPLRDAKGGELNPLVLSAFATAPKTITEAAERYTALFTAVDRRWSEARAAAKKAGTPEPAGLPDAADETLRKFLYAPRSPTTVPGDEVANNELYLPTSVCEELWKLQGEVDRHILKAPESPPHALVLTDREPERDPCVFIRGNPAQQGEDVPRQFVKIAAGPDRTPFKSGSGRLEMAKAIVRPENPLTARVMVNRIWMHHFGDGIVRSPSDFGLRAGPPSHPALLDWLALRFIADGWSVKRMHRLILLSAVYQQGTMPSAAGTLQSDPDNRLLAHFARRRLDFEQMRDAALAVTSELDPAIGGKAADLFSAANKRRTIYGLVDRQYLPGTFRVFDFANPDLHIGQRDSTTVPQQALFLLNHSFIADRAKALAARSEVARAPSPLDRVRSLYRSIYQRPPTEQEISAGLRFVTSAEAEASAPAPKPVESAWRYGWGAYDSDAERVKTFTALPHFAGDAWQGGPKWPDATLGWAQLTAEGGHPGDNLQHTVIRRWIAPRDAVVSITGELLHEPTVGDGIRGFIVSSRHGALKSAVVHHTKAEMSVPSIEVKAGETLDFIVDIRAGLNSDQFKWAPIITAMSTSPAGTWDARKEFSGPPPPAIQTLKPWEQYAQVLLLANEFSFVD